MTATTCPSCHGARRNVHRPDLLAVFDHDGLCALAAAEVDGHEVDLARHRKYGTPVRHRRLTPAESTLLRASGVALDSRAPVFARVSWSGDVRTRTWTGCALVALDTMTVPS